MKALLIAAAALGLSAGVANAADSTSTITLDGHASPECGGTANASTTIAGELTGTDGFLASDLQGRIQSALNSAAVTVYCTGGHNKVVISRTPLVLNTSNGSPNNGFATAILFDVGVFIAGGVRDPSDTYAGIPEGTSDGAGNGPLYGPFGPSGAGAAVTFGTDPYTASGFGGTALTQPVPVDATGLATAQANTSAYPPMPNMRLMAGTYTGSVVLTLTPGL